METKQVYEKDLDCASVDLISALVDICEKRWVKVNAGEVVRMHPEAYIVASMRISPTGSTTKSAAVDAGAVMCSIPLRVRLPAFSDEEMRRIIYVKYGRVAPFTRKLIAIFNDLLKENTLRKQNSKRMLTSTDLFRACERMQHLTDLTDNIAVMGELIDVWAMHCVSIEDVKSLAAVISDRLSVNRDQLEYYLNLRLPPITLEQERFICGRIQLRISAQKMHTGR
ncbi:unnamed protein product [Anisakis simplex]|uniref:Midasin (inferred by orthology to a human protein) n=1 Tax=Anisakis simplex TaxID=6269 RepID=A0A0M3J6C6_ANISI|nr:unnamed protein product [Anisakis simplex]